MHAPLKVDSPSCTKEGMYRLDRVSIRELSLSLSPFGSDEPLTLFYKYKPVTPVTSVFISPKSLEALRAEWGALSCPVLIQDRKVYLGH